MQFGGSSHCALIMTDAYQDDSFKLENLEKKKVK